MSSEPQYYPVRVKHHRLKPRYEPFSDKPSRRNISKRTSCNTSTLQDSQKPELKIFKPSYSVERCFDWTSKDETSSVIMWIVQQLAIRHGISWHDSTRKWVCNRPTGQNNTWSPEDELVWFLVHQVKRITLIMKEDSDKSFAYIFRYEYYNSQIDDGRDNETIIHKNHSNKTYDEVRPMSRIDFAMVKYHDQESRQHFIIKDEDVLFSEQDNRQVTNCNKSRIIPSECWNSSNKHFRWTSWLLRNNIAPELQLAFLIIPCFNAFRRLV